MPLTPRPPLSEGSGDFMWDFSVEQCSIYSRTDAVEKSKTNAGVGSA